MSATAPAPHLGQGSFDISGTAPIPLTRLVGVEIRKLVDTRAGRWLLMIQAGLILLGSVIFAIVVGRNEGSIGLFDFTTVAGAVTQLLLPVMAILAVTTEWSQRTNMATFTLEPRRGRVVAAKAAAAVIVGLAALVVAVAIGAVMNGLAGVLGADIDWDLRGEMLAAFALLQVMSLLIGFAFGTLLLNTPAAIVVYIAFYTIIPGILGAAGALMSWFEDIRPWIDYNTAILPLSDFGQPDNEMGFGAVEWPEFTTSVALWFVLPLVLGVLRMLRAEVK
ncbi:MAG TPA: ABC transporter permease [Nocardioides sp.]